MSILLVLNKPKYSNFCTNVRDEDDCVHAVLQTLMNGKVKSIFKTIKSRPRNNLLVLPNCPATLPNTHTFLNVLL